MALTDKLTAIADGFRSSRGTSDPLSLDEMAVLAAEPMSSGGDGDLDAILDKSIVDITSETDKIGEYALYKSDKLSTVDLTSATTIDAHAFDNCSNITVLVLRSETLCWLNDISAFSNTPIESGYGLILVPSALLETYQKNVFWSTYVTAIRAIEDFTVDGTVSGELRPIAILDVAKATGKTWGPHNNTTYNNEQFILFYLSPAEGETITAICGDSVSNIKEGILENVFLTYGTFTGIEKDFGVDEGPLIIVGNCDLFTVGEYNESSTFTHFYNQVKTVLRWGGIANTEIYPDMFNANTNLKLTSLPEGITSIGDSAFHRCSGIELTSLPSGVTRIGDTAFFACSGLKTMTLPESLTYIGTKAFQFCSQLTSVEFENPSGWWVSTSATATSGTSVDLSDPANNATLLKSTYLDYYWHRS